MICPICGKTITDNSKFCGRCGGNIIEFYNQASSTLLSNAFRLLKEHKKDQAKEIIDKVFLRNAQDPDANVGKLLLECGVESIEDLTVLSKDISSSSFYKNIMVFGDEQLKAKLQSISASLKEKEITSNKNAQYESAIQLMKDHRYLDAKDSFENLGNWMDAEEKARQCETLHIEYQRKLEEEKRNEAIRKAKTRKRNRIIIAVSSIAIIFGVAIGLATKYYFIPSSKYSEAMELIEAEKYDEGYAVLEKLGTFKGSDQFILESKYNRAITEIKRCNYDYAYSILAQIGTYHDADELILQNKYDRAKKHIESKEYTDAFALLTQLGDYSDSSTVLSNARYQYAFELKTQGKYEEAIKAFEVILSYDDSGVQIKDCKYLLARDLYSKKAIADAYRRFKEISSYEDSSTYISKIETDYPTVKFLDSDIGDCVKFGKYEQDNNSSNGKETIEWIVLSKEGSKALLLSKYALDVMQFNKSKGFVKWADSSVRSWLKSDFYNTAFSGIEKKAILNVSNDNICEKGKVDDGKTTDTVFLLSKEEYDNYIDNTDLDDKYTAVKYTSYAKAMEMQRQQYESEDMSWWLRTRSEYEEYGEYNFVWFVEYGCYYSNPGTYYWGIRPAIWVEIEQ